MNCLWLTRQDPRPADSGELIYSLGLIRSLAAAGAELTVLCHAPDSAIVPLERTEAAGDDHEIRWKFVARRLRPRFLSLFSRLPSDAFRLSSAPLRSRLRSLLKAERWDYVIVDHAAMAWTLDEILRSSSRNRPTPSILYVSHNHEGLTRSKIARNYGGRFPMRALLHFDALKYAALEERLCARADLISAITPSDEKAYRRDWPKKHLLTLMPGFAGDASPPRSFNSSTPPTVLYLGSFQWLAKRMNLRRFVEVAAPVFEREGIRLQIVGKADLDFVCSIIKGRDWCHFAANPPVLDSFFKDARIGVIAEESGGGFKLKALDYLFHRLPMAALAENLSDLRFSPGVDYLDAANVEQLVETIAANINRFERLDDLANRACDNHSHRFGWEERGETLLEAMEDARYGIEPIEYAHAALA